ncbi:MAG: AbrB/MazE/SpoVT family DNA-binding domain-containing protein [Chloroflexi bacterium]|nr:AbrB/MazE/SpoVT family DNA-binding domain-containing protein [Chloroflexota bacterium]
MLGLATITSKNQITIPKEIREALNLRPKDRLLMTVQGDRIIMIPIRVRPISELFGALPVDEPTPDIHTIRKMYHEELARRIAEGEE